MAKVSLCSRIIIPDYYPCCQGERPERCGWSSCGAHLVSFAADGVLVVVEQSCHDCRYCSLSRGTPGWHTRGAMPAPQCGRGKPEAARTAGKPSGPRQGAGPDARLTRQRHGWLTSPPSARETAPETCNATPNSPPWSTRANRWLASVGIQQWCGIGAVLAYPYTTLPWWRSSCASLRPWCASR